MTENRHVGSDRNAYCVLVQSTSREERRLRGEGGGGKGVSQGKGEEPHQVHSEFTACKLDTW